MLSCGLDATAAEPNAAQDIRQLSTVVVQGRQLSDSEQAQQRLNEVPGGTAQVEAASVEKRRTATNQDVLAYQPGVYAQAVGGGDGIKLSIRGSGINKGVNYFRSGVYLMFDGLPVSGPGGTPYELFEPLGLARTEILRGANGFDYGSLTLGGAINYVTRTGYDASPLEVRYEAGSYGYQKRQIASGQVLGDLDYYVSLTDSDQDGYQNHTTSSSKGFAGNVGYRFSPDLETRFYLRYRETDNETGGLLTRDEIAHHNRRANATSLSQDASRIQPGSTWLANKTTLRLDDSSRLELGAVYHNYPIDVRGGVNRAVWGYRDVSGTVQYIRDDDLFGHASTTRLGLLSTRHLQGDGFQRTTVRIPSGATAGLQPGTLVRNAEYEGSDNVFHASNDLELVPDLWLTTGLSMIYTNRETEVDYPVTNSRYKNNDWDYAPRLGLRYDFNPHAQVYANVSRSVEPPSDWQILSTPPSFTSGPATGLAREGVDLQNQTATTFELGGRGQIDNHKWTLSYYYSRVNHELLSVEVQAASATTAAITAESNASATVHEGVEAGLESLLWQGSDTNRLTLRQAYTYSHFHYVDDDRFGANELPGIPEHYYQGELQYDFNNGVYVGVNAQIGSKMAVDYANSYYTRPYQAFGATLGWNSPKKTWQTYVDLRNLGNERYTTVISPAYDDGGVDRARSYPSDGFGVYGGVSYRFN
ncbi:TonB-dependent receptor family protein [Pseudomonas sp. v388]|uniref:TonB-dependent receptor family protein n=1 Tax=Pseudomonas sp. v388 TaxID=2479849 RepID=UPI003531DF87